ncbi:NfeD family protein [Solirhodobacter olei]|uniref:NfeD family protein n=1 Tax=Solirhodobacter olei TaxID=2493082 RepID=UPI000FDBEF59|nr:nodulation protein NfeD [Solirhodobacter olei]
MKRALLTVVWKLRRACSLGLGVLILAFLVVPASAQQRPKVYVLSLDSAVGPVSAGYVVDGFKQAAAGRADAVVLQIDTPGGLDTAMRQIIQAILASPVPVIGYVSPSGARAASAGTYILYACQLAAMAPGTNLGAATPVSLFGGTKLPGKAASGDGGAAAGSQPPDAEATKVTNDAVAYIRGLAKLHNRNADWAEKAVREAASLPYDQALKEGVIDLVAPNLPALLRAADGRTVTLASGPVTLHLAGAELVHIAPGFRIRLLSALTDPNIVLILLLLGVYGLVFEFSHPGLIAPGVIGAISLLVALYALSIIPVDLAGLALTVLGLGLMAAEAFVPSFGALGLGGAGAFLLGALMAFDTPGYRLSLFVAIGATLFAAGLFLIVLAMLIRARRKPKTSGDTRLLGATARVIDWSDATGEVEVLGERWSARGPAGLVAGQPVRIAGRQGLTLDVVPE